MLRLTCLLLILSTVLGLQPSETYPNSEVLDSNGDYKLYWKYNATHITFETLVNTAGFTGFGISKNGTSMFPADVVMGYVDHGTSEFKDLHTTAHAPPLQDAHQDWVLLASMEDHSGTMLKFERALDTTSDKEDGNTIHAGMTDLIWCFGADDMFGSYHGATNRGGKRVQLIRDDVPVGK